MSEAVDAAPPIYYRGVAHRAPKTFWDGTHRVRSPEETLDLIRPFFPVAGITRLADITGLDRIGIPTVVSVRPNSPTLATGGGKGFTIQAAMASAAMEAIEFYHAEEIFLPRVRDTYSHLAATANVIPLERLSLNRHAIFSTQWPFDWTMGWDIVDQCEVAAPLVSVDLVFNDERRQREENRLWNLGAFPAGTNGLASGNVFLEATAAGLYEVIERDGVTLHSLAEKKTGRPPPTIRLETIEDERVMQLIERCRAANVAPMLFDCTVDTEVPIYRAVIYEEDTRHSVGMYKGYGAHLDPAIAMIRALTEAIQSRLVYISGARDDVFRNSFQRQFERDSEDAVAWFRSQTATVDARDRKSMAEDSFEADIGLLIRKLGAVGLNQILVFDLTLPDWPISVVRVMVPGLEGYKASAFTPGLRAQAYCKAFGL